MRFFTTTAVFGLSSLLFASAAPIDSSTLPPGNGFPNPTPGQVKQIQLQAFGTLPNGSVPANLSTEGITNLQLIALNEIFEVNFFTSLLKNVTTNVKGFAPPQGMSKDFVVATLQAILAQEELHALNANGALKHFGAKPIEACTHYVYGTTTFAEAIKLAGTFTSVVLGTLQDVALIFGENGAAPLIRLITSVVGNEAEQEGWFRLMQGQLPSELPFLTASVRDFAFTALQGFAAPGSCPSVASIPLKTLQPLTVVDTPTAKTETIRYSFPSANYTDGEPLWVTYLNQQNVPVSEAVTFISKKDGMVTISATFPYEAQELNGLTIASITNSDGPFASPDAIIPAAIYGPGLIIVQPASTQNLTQHTTGYYVAAGSS